MAGSQTSRFRDTYAPLAVFIGDTMVTFGALTLGFFLRYASPLGRWGLDVPDARFSAYLPLLMLGTMLLVAAFANLGLYDSRMLLRRYRSLNLILKALGFWLVAYLGVSLVLKFNPPISRLFVLIGFGCVSLSLTIWRVALNAWLLLPSIRPRLQQRAALLGWNASAISLWAELSRDPHHPYTAAGIISLPTDPVPPPQQHLGAVDCIADILRDNNIDLLIATRVDFRRTEWRNVIETCERLYVEWKIVPAAFDIFLTGLRLQTIGRTPVLGVEELAITKLFSRLAKRAMDICGALLGLIGAAPVILYYAWRIKRESPNGPIFFRQVRIGIEHRPFTLYKLRSMTPGASKDDHLHQSTATDDPRLLQVGRFIRKWNIDELPQFWNVLLGDMSLVGPRPERPHHVDQLSTEIPHYLPRHVAKPGMTGWAQVHRLRGDTSIERRIQYDIFYIENWSLWLDLQIMLLTFLRWRDESP